MLAPLDKMPAPDAAKIVTDWPTDRAVASLLALGETPAAQIINRCDDPVAGKLPSVIAADHPVQARRFLVMVTAERVGRLLDHMSSADAASALSLPPAPGAVRALARASDLTAADVLLEMRAPNAADLVMAMDSERAVNLLTRVPPATLADFLRNILPARRQAPMNRLPVPLRSLVARHL